MVSNVVYISPHFPANFCNFSINLSKKGINVLGIADEPFGNLPPKLSKSLTEYYLVNDMHNYDELLRAIGFFTHKYGKIDRIVSQNEYWLTMEARLRTDFNVPGTKLSDIDKIKKKSQMKQAFINSGVQVARGELVTDIAAAEKFIKTVGYPVVAKPDIGVGAADTHKINNNQELNDFFANKTAVEYIMEEFVDGIIYSFDGIADKHGKVVFYASHKFEKGIMETVNEDFNLAYYSLRNIPEDLLEAGKKLVKEFDVKESFFHFEFFRLPDNRLIALEVNIRPPGGLTTDMMNFANDIDIYREWANVVVDNNFTAQVTRPYYTAYIGRKSNRDYKYTHGDVLNTFPDEIVAAEKMSPVFSQVMGTVGYIARTKELDRLKKIINFVQGTY